MRRVVFRSIGISKKKKRRTHFFIHLTTWASIVERIVFVCGYKEVGEEIVNKKGRTAFALISYRILPMYVVFFNTQYTAFSMGWPVIAQNNQSKIEALRFSIC